MTVAGKSKETANPSKPKKIAAMFHISFGTKLVSIRYHIKHAGIKKIPNIMPHNPAAAIENQSTASIL